MGETGPRAILPSVVECPYTGKTVAVFEEKDPNKLRHKLSAFVHWLYIR